MKRMLIIAALVWSSAATAQEHCRCQGSSSVDARIMAAIAVSTASKKCGFGIDDDKLGSWVLGDAGRLTAEQRGFAMLMSLGSDDLKEQLTESECQYWKTEADDKGWLVE